MSILTLELTTHDGQPVTGWSYLWAKHVSGFDQTTHCARALRGMYEQQVSKSMAPGAYEVPLRGHFLYLCGVASFGGYRNNLHLVVAPEDGAEAEVVSYLGDRFRIRGGRAREIPPLPHHWNGLGSHFTTCRNFQFGVAAYGYTRPEADLPPSARPVPLPERKSR